MKTSSLTCSRRKKQTKISALIRVNPLPQRDANRADSDQATLVRALPDQSYSVCLWKYDIPDPTQVDLTSNFFVLCTNVKVYLYNYS